MHLGQIDLHVLLTIGDIRTWCEEHWTGQDIKVSEED